MTSLRGIAHKYPLLPILLIAGASLIILTIMHPWLMVSATTPTGGDTGAHVFGPAFLRDTLLPEGRILGWSKDWFAGFPAFYFYFPLPSLVIVGLDLFLPYGVAFKLVTAMGLVALPPAIYFHARALRLGTMVSVIAAGTGAVFAFMESYSIYGGNIASTLAGEFSYSWSFSISLVYLGLLIKAVRDDRKYAKWAALAMAAMALSHVLTTIVAIFASLFVLAWRKGFWKTIAIWVWGFGLAAFWAIPLVARIGLSSDMGWNPLSGWEELLPIELWLLLPVAIPGGIWAFKRSRRAGPMIGATLLPVIYYPLPRLLPEQFPELFAGERWKLWNGRLLPYWYFGVAFFAAIGFGAAVAWLSRRLPERSPKYLVSGSLTLVFATAVWWVRRSPEIPGWVWVVVAVTGVVVVVVAHVMGSDVDTRNFMMTAGISVLVLGALAGVSFVDGWSRWNYDGYEAKQPWPEYESLMAELSGLPEGRVMWEANSGLNKYGTPMSPMLIPYWTEGSHGSMEGLYFESSLTTPFHFINHSEMSYRPSNPIPGLRYHTFDMERGLEHMDVYGVSYYVSFTPEAREKAQGIEQMELLTITEPFAIFRLPETALVEVASYLPAVYEVPERNIFDSLMGTETVVGSSGQPLPSFHDMALEWYEDVDEMHRLVVAKGPDDWPRIESVDERPDTVLPTADAVVSNIVVDDHRISFTTDAVGMPHVIKVSYFPNWTATGADGPWRATPSLMVVVPTERDVVLDFTDTWAESVGKILTLAGLGGLVVALVVWRRRRLSELRPEAPSGP